MGMAFFGGTDVTGKGTCRVRVKGHLSGVVVFAAGSLLGSGVLREVQ